MEPREDDDGQAAAYNEELNERYYKEVIMTTEKSVLVAGDKKGTRRCIRCRRFLKKLQQLYCARCAELRARSGVANGN